MEQSKNHIKKIKPKEPVSKVKLGKGETVVSIKDTGAGKGCLPSG